MEIGNDQKSNESEGNGAKLDIKNIALKAPKKSKKNRHYDNPIWGIFWISNVPKRECVSDVRKEYTQVMENMTA